MTYRGLSLSEAKRKIIRPKNFASLFAFKGLAPISNFAAPTNSGSYGFLWECVHYEYSSATTVWSLLPFGLDKNLSLFM